MPNSPSVSPGGAHGIADGEDTLNADEPDQHAHDGGMHVHAIGDDLEGDRGILAGGDEDARLAVVDASHAVKGMRNLARAGGDVSFRSVV